MAFNGTEGELISLKDGAAMTAAYRSANPGGMRGHFFGREVLNQILSQEGCMGIRMYYGINEEGVQQLIIVGANSEEQDLTAMVADVSVGCPYRCDPSSALNG